MRQRTATALAAACVVVTLFAALRGVTTTTAAAATLPAFPGAEGFGANSTGGRGGDVYHVTTLADDPSHVIPGSLYYGLYEKHVPPEGRTIVFDVGGTIQLGATALDIKNINKVTIAGQTAPSPITIVGNTVQITGSSGKTTSNIILQHINLRKGTAAGEDALSVKGAGSTNNIIVDHVSGSWSEDEVISVTQNATNVTIQNSTLSEALTSNHAYGALIRPMINSNVSYNRNLFSNQKSRNPRPGSYDGATLNLEFQNNVIYNWSDRAGYIAGADTDLQILNMNYTGNYLIAGPVAASSTSRATAFFKENNTSGPLELHVYQQANVIDSNATPARDGTDTGWNMFKQLTSGAAGAWAEADKAASRFLYPANTPDSADVAYAKTIAQVGALPWARGATDQRLINDVINYTGTAPVNAPPADEWNAIMTAPTVTRPADWDTEVIPGNYFGTTTPRARGDGMPTWWEVLRGFDPNADDKNVVTAEGYTRLEKYLHFLSAQANWNLNADGNWSAHMNWRGMRPGTKDASASFISGITAPRTVTIDAAVTVGQMSFSSPIGYTLAGGNALTVDVISGKAQIDVSAGSHTIAAPLALAKDMNINVAGGTSLTVSNLQPTAAALVKQGQGTLNVNGVRAASLNVQAGVVQVIPSGGTAPASRASNITIAAGAKMDLGDGKLVIVGGNIGTASGSTYGGVQGLVQRGYVNSAWSGDGITTSMSDATNGLTTLGVGISGGDVVVMYTYAGDLNFDGRVDAQDYGIIDNWVQFPGTDGYANGDINYDGVIDATDYGIIDNTIQLQGAPITVASAAIDLSAVAAVPEPSACGFAGIVAASLLTRRRRRHQVH
jgi:pectate lyase